MCIFTAIFGRKQPASPSDTLIPVAVTKTVTRQEYLDTLGLVAYNASRPLDGTVALCSKEDLDRIASYLVLPADDYIADIADCDKYGLNAEVKCCFSFKFSAVRLSLGNVNNFQIVGYHGFVVALDDQGNKWILEPNAGFEYAGVWFEFGVNGYSPEVVLV